MLEQAAEGQGLTYGWLAAVELFFTVAETNLGKTRNSRALANDRG
jgi:hypothetical protein